MNRIKQIIVGAMAVIMSLSCLACGTTDNHELSQQAITTYEVHTDENVAKRVYNLYETTVVSSTTERTTTTTTTTLTTTSTTETTTTVEEETTIYYAPVIVEETVPIVTETETTTTTTTTTTSSSVTTEVTTTQEVDISIVYYKPKTHYIHKSNCKWIKDSNPDEYYEINSTEGIDARRCSDCQPDMEIMTEYIEETPVSNLTYVKNFSRGTYYAYGGARYGGSGRDLIDCSYGDGYVKGSIASSYLYYNYGYYYGGRTTVYLEIYGYPSMSGYYYLDDCDAGNSEVIDFFYYYGGNCQFQNQGVVSVDCYIVN